MVKHNISKLRANGITVKEYINSLEGKSGKELEENYNNYKPKKEVVQKLKEKAKGYTFIAFSAVWCKDCKTNMAAFAKIVEQEPELDAICFKGIKSAPLDPDIRWRIPPSPKEVDEFDLARIPTFYILDSDGNQVAVLEEHPKVKETVEEELLYLLENL